MYYLLVEAAGLRQISKIRPERYRELADHLATALEGGGFALVLQEGDLLLYRQKPEMSVQPELLATVARSTLEVLRSESDELLDFLIVVDYRDTHNAQDELTHMHRVLRRARIENTVYVTEPVRVAIEPLVESEEYGDIHRIVAFTGGDQMIRQRYVDALMLDEITGEISRTVLAEKSGFIGLVAPDTSAVGASLACLKTDAQAHILVQCSPVDTIESVLQTIVAQLPELPREQQSIYGVEEIDHRHHWAAEALHARFSDPASLLLSEGWRRGELGMLLNRWAATAARHRQWVLVEVRDFDLLAPDVAHAVTAYLSAPGVATAVRGVAVCVSPPSGVDHIVEVPSAGEQRYGAAVEYWSNPDHDPRSLSPHHRSVIYLLHRLGGVLRDEDLYPFIAALGITPAERVRVMQDLQDLGVVQGFWTSQINPAAESLLSSLMTREERNSVEETIQDVMSSRIRSVGIPLSPVFLELLNAESRGSGGVEQRHAILHTLAGGGAFEAVARIASGEDATPHHARVTEASARIRLYLRDSRGPEACTDDAALLRSSVEDARFSPESRADFVLSLGEFHLARRDYTQALNAAKGATVLLQNASSSSVGAGHLLMARVLLVQRRLGDAGRYLGFAREEAHEDPATELIARSLEAVRLFLSGNLSRSAAQFTELLPPLLRSGFSEWLLLAWFALGRIDFELGAYHRAAAQFAMSRDWAAACEMHAPARTIEAWMQRARFLAEEPVPPDYFDRDPADMTAEEKLFIAEALITRNDYDGALELLNAAEQEEQAAPRWPRLGVCWDNGYAPMEDLLIADEPGRSELLRMVQAFRAWMLALTDRQDEGVEILYRLTRGNDGLSVDPYAGLFNYLYACILPAERSADRDDRTTVLGKSVKLVQERMSRIDDYRDKMRYLRSNTWNRRLMDAARSHNLVS